MAFRLNTGRSQQWSNACSHNLLKNKDSIMRYTKLQKMVVTTCDVHFAGVLMIWNRSYMHLTSGEIQRRSCSSLS